MVSVVQILISSRRVTPHLVWPSKVWLILNSIHDPVHQLLQRNVHFPCLYAQFLDPQILLGPWLKTPLQRLTRDRSLAFILLSVILQSFILFDTPHQLPHILGRPSCQRVLQFRILEQSQSKSACCDFFIILTDLVIQFPVSASVATKGFPSSYLHR